MRFISLRPEKTTVLGIRVFLCFLAFGSFALLAGNWLNATFSIWSRSTIVDFTRAAPDAQGVYTVELTVPVDQTRIFPSQIRLVDANQDKFAFTPSAKSLLAHCEGLFTIQQKRSLLVQWPISPIALRPKGEGLLTFPVLFAPWITNAAFFLLSGSSVALFWWSPFPTWNVRVLAQRLGGLAERTLRMLGRHPSIVLTIPSVYLLSVYPPLWKDLDALTQLILQADVGNIYHFPALYCFSARLIVGVGDFFLTWRLPDLLASQKPTLQGIYFLVVAQHFALILALGLLCKTLTKRDDLRGAFVMGFFFASSLYSSVMMCGSEAWSLCAVIALFSFGLRLYSAQGIGSINWICYGSSLVLAIGSRHINLLSGFWLISLFLTASIIRLRAGHQSGLPSRPLLKAGLALVLLFVAVFSNSFLQLCLATRVGIEPRTTLGHTLSDRIDTFLAEISPAERAGLAEELTAATSDRNVKLAVQDQATIGSFYKGTNTILEEQLRAAGLNGEHLQAEKDRVILKATLLYLKTLHPALVRVIWQDFLKGFAETSNFSLAIDPFVQNSNVGKYRLDKPDAWIPLNMLSSTFLPESVALLDRSVTDIYFKGRSVKGFRRLHLGSTLLLTLLCLVLCFWNHRGVYSRAIPALTILLTGICVFAATMICVFFMTRYVLPLWVSILIALGLAIDGLFERCRLIRQSDNAH